MARATDADVRELVIDMESTVSTSPYIATAGIVISELLGDAGLSETLLTQIEIYLAAHFAVLAVEKGGLRQETIDDITVGYQTGIVFSSRGFNATRFGQTAVAMDTSGILSAASSPDRKGIAEFRVY